MAEEIRNVAPRQAQEILLNLGIGHSDPGGTKIKSPPTQDVLDPRTVQQLQKIAATPNTTYVPVTFYTSNKAPSPVASASQQIISGQTSINSPQIQSAMQSGGYTPPGPSAGYQAAYQPIVDARGNVSPFTPADFGFITPQAVEQFNATLAQYPGTQAQTAGQAFPSQAQALQSAGVPAGNQTGFESLPQTGEFIGGVNVKGESGAPPFAFNFGEEQTSAYEKLKPFYEKLVEFAKGDINLAKRILEYTYQIGMRESRQEHEQETRRQALEFPQEKQRLTTDINRRGLLTSGIGNVESQRLAESQALRREAVNRALENRESRLVSGRGFGLEKEQRGFQKGLFDTEREKKRNLRV